MLHARVRRLRSVCSSCDCAPNRGARERGCGFGAVVVRLKYDYALRENGTRVSGCWCSYLTCLCPTSSTNFPDHQARKPRKPQTLKHGVEQRSVDAAGRAFVDQARHTHTHTRVKRIVFWWSRRLPQCHCSIYTCKSAVCGFECARRGYKHV